MQYPSYSLTAFNRNYSYEFTSISDTQVIEKIINFTLLDIEDELYNLSFGDKNKDLVNSNAIDDKVVSNNGDMVKILATLFQAILLFTQDKEVYKIVFRGSTPSRTRLYRIAISNNYEELSKYFNIYGFDIEGKLIFFAKNKEYQGFLITPNMNSIK
ncbi:hypothetical protein HX057_10015 [Myroides odoratimimus]|uniref:Uncharacterized protein n=1 Tax=Myroides odoratimimus CIP 101113 TaxID=883154 RepID=A0AAV3F856_9FLAO|nr:MULTISPECIES: hypothetical protein [Myroides]EHO15320.1 hypothetical protein HMPREF9714_00077 [Myroides odoratimimus CCUG 12901]EHO15511.1 hypothetical protein HMPREF9715_00082 [Myroides odoratimimus CIP 101113]MCA4791281.1 hypothetical protein [Myroides odoratimimus]MCA4818541.1 hypothetical protein [Myroides odoratimimus]MDM1058069.1 hypothetical protein [Myroides odoratimimus]